MVFLLGYVRVSTKMQAETGESIETQQKIIQKEADYRGLKVKWYIDEGKSGKNIEGRPQMQKLLKEMKKGDFLMIADLSRIARNMFDFTYMIKRFNTEGINFICKNPDIDLSTAAGRLIAVVMSSVYEMERENISKHVQRTLNRLREEKKLRGTAPFGWQFIGKEEDMQMHPGEQKLLTKIKFLYLQGMTANAIAKQLNEDGDFTKRKPTKSGEKKKFHSITITNILKDVQYIKKDADDKRVPIPERLQNKKEVVLEPLVVEQAEIIEWKKKVEDKKENILKNRVSNFRERPKTPRIMTVRKKIEEIEEMAPVGNVLM